MENKGEATMWCKDYSLGRSILAGCRNYFVLANLYWANEGDPILACPASLPRIRYLNHSSDG